MNFSVTLKSFALMFLLIIGLSCTNAPDLGKLSSNHWKSDKNGCLGKRLDLLPELIAIREKLKGQTQNQIIQLLGKPDQQEIYKRSQKFFTYYISGNNSCNDHEKDMVYLQIRFNALGNSNEVLIVK